jgi:hypothetical protein
VLEHVPHFQVLVDEMHRVMKDGAEIIATVPWSARYHYVPHDFFRYTPSSLRTMFSAFRDVEISPRGSDVSAIGSKLVVLWFRNMLPARRRKLVFVPLWILASPVLLVSLAIVHICTSTGAGSTDDPLGYTIVARK